MTSSNKADSLRDDSDVHHVDGAALENGLVQRGSIPIPENDGCDEPSATVITSADLSLMKAAVTKLAPGKKRKDTVIRAFNEDHQLKRLRTSTTNGILEHKMAPLTENDRVRKRAAPADGKIHQRADKRVAKSCLLCPRAVVRHKCTTCEVVLCKQCVITFHTADLLKKQTGPVSPLRK